jgi:SAM-dependent methyltransferase/uncharacterized damage-inducible protein DinB
MENQLAHRQAWFDRSFNFKDTAMTFSGLIERLRDAPMRLSRKTKGLPSDVLTRQEDRKWSIQEHAGHLLDLENLWIGRVDDIISGQETMRSADLTNQKTFDANHNTSKLEIILDAFDSARSAFVAACEASKAAAEKAFTKHPRLGTPMRLIDLMYFVAEHDDHHLASISQILVVLNPKSGPVEDEKDDYVLGTHQKELWRLGFQHQVWASVAHESWKTAGFAHGQTILDLGCGPGFTARDLAYLVGDQGRIIAVDQSRHFTQFLDEISRLHGLPIETQTVSFNEMNLQAESLDGVYCRWALAWLKDPEAIIQKTAQAMRPGATFIVHEYFDWKTFQTEPYSDSIKVSLESILESFRLASGDINIGRHVPRIFEAIGLEVISTKPLSKIARSGDLTWQWPKTFLEIYLPRVVAMGLLKENEMQAALADWRKIEASPHGLCFTPQMIEVIGRKVG